MRRVVLKPGVTPPPVPLPTVAVVVAVAVAVAVTPAGTGARQDVTVRLVFRFCRPFALWWQVTNAQFLLTARRGLLRTLDASKSLPTALDDLAVPQRPVLPLGTYANPGL